MALLSDAHLGCAVTWQDRVDKYHLCVFPCMFVCTRQSVSGSALPVKECAPACDRACVYQQECFSCHSKGQLIIWSAASPVVVTAADCHEDRCRKRGECMWRRRIVRKDAAVYLCDHGIGKHNGQLRNYPRFTALSPTQPTIQKK